MGEGYRPRIMPQGAGAPTLPAIESPGSMALGLGVAALRLGGDLADQEREQRREADGVAVTDAVGTYMKGVFSTVKDPEKGMLTRQLAQAEGATAETAQSLDSLASDISGKLSSQLQRDTFAKMIQSQRESALSTVASHESEQLAKHRDYSVSVLIDGAQESGQMAVQNDPGSAATAALHQHNIDAIVSSIKLRLSGKVAPEELAAAQRAAISDYWAGTPGTRSVGVIGAVADGQEHVAAALLKEHYDDINPVARLTIEHRLEVANVRAEGQQTADTLWTEGKGDLGTALDLAAKIKDVPVRQEAEARLRQRAEDGDRARKAAEEQVFNVAEPAFRRTERVSAIPSSVWAKMTTAQRDYFRRAEQGAAEASGIKWNDVPDSVMQDWYAYKGLPPEKKIEENLLVRFGHRIPIEGVRQLAEEQETYRDALSRADAKDPKYTKVMTVDELLSTTAKRAGLIDWKGKSSETQLKRYAMFQEAAQAAFKDYETQKYDGKRQASVDELKPIAERLVIAGELDRPWWQVSPDKYAFEAAGDPTFRPDIPSDERSLIEASLKKAGIPVTSAAVAHYFMKMHGLAK